MIDEASVLIIGARGQLGIALSERFPNAQKADREELDIANWEAINNFDWSKVKLVINAAAYTNVDGAETPAGRELAWKVNAQAVGFLSKVACAHDIILVHISSEYVFDGTKNPHLEDEPFTPLGVYAQTKAAGDIAVSIVPKHYILRTSWVIGEGKNFVRTMINLAERNISPTVVADQIGRLTFTSTLVDAVEHLIKTSSPFGTYNVSNDGAPASWADITRAIFEDLGRGDLKVSDTTTVEYFAGKEGVAPRPLHSEMDLAKIRSTGLVLRNWQDELNSYIQAEKAKSKE